MTGVAFNLSNIISKLKEVVEPHELGIHLGIKTEVLKKIEKDYQHQVNRQKSEVIEHWLNNGADCSWGALATAVEKMGEHGKLVEKLWELAEVERSQVISDVHNVISEQDREMNTDSSVMKSQCLAPPISTSPSTLADQQSQTSIKQQPTEKMEHEEISSNPQHMSPLAKRYKLSLKPREYQKELAQPGIEGKNYIVVAPTNSGKTLVAAMVIANHLEKNSDEKRPPKAVMVVKTRPLADQQVEQLSKYIPNARVECRTGNRGEIRDRNLQLHIKDALPLSDIIVCTAGKLLDELKKRMVAMQEISLLIVDECHNTERNSNYAQMMHTYLELTSGEATKDRLPQVVGLTATPGVGRNPGLSPAKAVDNLVMLCAYMDAQHGIQTVRKHTDELSKFVRKPDSDQDSVIQNEKRQVFIKRIEEEMQVCENFLGISISQSPRWSQQYEQVVKENKAVHEESSNPDDRDLVSTARLLECYSQTLINYMDLPYDQVMDMLDRYDDFDWSAPHVPTDHEKCLQARFQKLKDDLSSLEKCENPILEKLEQQLTTAFQKCSNSAGIVFVRTREQAEVISNWIAQAEFADVVGIIPEMLIGHTRREDGPSMSDEDQKRVVHQFSKGECNLLVATSVAEEGLDIKQCNLVIRLHISSARSKAQAQGRTRAEDSKIITITSNDPKKLYRDILNDELLLLMERLLETDSLPSAHQLQQEIMHKQKLIREKMANERELQNIRANSHPAGDVELQCKRCKIRACRGSDIYFIDKTNHHVVPGPDFSTLYVPVDHHVPGYVDGCYDPVIEKNYKIHCLNCNQSWGVLGTSPTFEYPILKCESFNFNVGGRPKNFRKWKDRPFKVLPLSQWFTQTSSEDESATEQATGHLKRKRPHATLKDTEPAPSLQKQQRANSETTSKLL